MKVTAVVPAAGSGLRISNAVRNRIFSGAKKKDERKPFFIVRNKPILAHTLLALEGSKKIDDIIVVVHKDDVKKCRDIVKKYKLRRISGIIPGGKTRFESVKEGLLSVARDSDIIFIHDGVRPLVGKKMISRSIKACKSFSAAVCGIPVVSTVKFIDNNLTVKATPDRRMLYMVQTPQVFKRDLILKAYDEALRSTPNAADDSVLVERLGHKVKIIPGSYENIKVTTPEDLMLVEALLRRRKNR